MFGGGRFGVRPTRRWREVDSNCRSFSRNGSVSPAERELRKREKGSLEAASISGGPGVRIRFPSVANVAFGGVAEGNGVGHILVVVPEPTRDLEEFATSVVGFELA